MVSVISECFCSKNWAIFVLYNNFFTTFKAVDCCLLMFIK